MDSVLSAPRNGADMSTPDDREEIPVAFDEETLAGIDRLRREGGYDSRSEVVAAAIDAAGE